MADDTYTLDVPAEAWLEVVEGPLEVNATGTDNFYYAFSAAIPTTVVGHFRLANHDLVARPNTGQSLWVRGSGGRAFKLTVTEEAVA